MDAQPTDAAAQPQDLPRTPEDMDALPTGTTTPPQDSSQTQEAMDTQQPQGSSQTQEAVDTQHTGEPDQLSNQDPDEMNICETDT